MPPPGGVRDVCAVLWTNGANALGRTRPAASRLLIFAVISSIERDPPAALLEGSRMPMLARISQPRA
jgi:hypothetical protein